MHSDTVIIGAGLAGLSCRAGLSGVRDSVVLEREAKPGGLVRVYERGEYTFDSTVHVLFFRDPVMKRAVLELVSPVHAFEKRNTIWQFDREIRYPYQYHAADLPDWVRRDCLAPFVAGDARAQAHPPRSFEEWLVRQFGTGFYRHFFGPYNRKLYGRDPAEMDPRRMVWTIPADNRDAVLAGAVDPPEYRGGECYYPRGRKGISRLADALLAMGEGDLRLGTTVVSIEPAEHRVTCANGETWQYRNLISTVPLPRLLALIDQALPTSIADARGLLCCAPVTAIEVGVQRKYPEQRDVLAHWTYYPDASVPHYRMTRLETISPDLCAGDRSALLLECSGPEPPPEGQVLESLRATRVIREGDQVEHYRARKIPSGYVVFLHGVEQLKSRIFAYLGHHQISSVGRFGEWDYFNCEQAIVSGLRAARSLRPAARRSSVLEYFGI